MQKILIVEDNPKILRLFTKILGDIGYEINGVQDAYEALFYLSINTVDLILTDLILPGMSGIELVTTLRSHPSTEKTVILAITGLSDSTNQEKAMAAGCTAFIVKPIRMRRLVETVKSYMPLQEGFQI